MPQTAYYCPGCAACIGYFRSDKEFMETYPVGCPYCSRGPDQGARDMAKAHHASNKPYPKNHPDAMAARETMLEGK